MSGLLNAMEDGITSTQVRLSSLTDSLMSRVGQAFHPDTRADFRLENLSYLQQERPIMTEVAVA